MQVLKLRFLFETYKGKKAPRLLEWKNFIRNEKLFQLHFTSKRSQESLLILKSTNYFNRIKKVDLKRNI